MMVPAEAAVITKGRPYVGLVVAAAVAVRVAKLSPSLLTTRRKSVEKTVHCLVASSVATSHQNPNANVIAGMSSAFLPHRQFALPRSGTTQLSARRAGPVSGSGVARSLPVGF